jgi:hypothetical protein
MTESRPKIIAANITNLTDARYFAAWEVDFLLFDLDVMSLEKVDEIREWVSGPELLLLFSGLSAGNVEEAILKLKPWAIGTKDPSEVSQFEFLRGHVRFFDYQTVSDRIQIEIDDDIFTLCANLDEVKNTAPNHIIIQGSEEELTGVKLFQDIDTLFEWLSD